MKATFLCTLLTAILLFTIQASHAEVFRWVDEFGKIHIGIKPSAKPANEKKDNKKSNMEIKKAPSVITRPVAPKPIVEQATSSAPSARIAEAPQTATPAAKSAPAPIVTTPEVVVPTKQPVLTQPPKPVQKTSVNKPEPVKKKVSVKKPTVKKPVVKKTVSRKKPETTTTQKKIAKKKSAGKRNEEMCGVFTGYVNNYEEKVRDCSPNLCDIYKRALARYKKKQTSYCK